MNSSLAPSVLGGNASHKTGAGGSKGKGVVYEAKAQLFRPTAGTADKNNECTDKNNECTYVSAVTVQVTSVAARAYAKDTAQFHLSLLTVAAPTSAHANGVSPLDSHALDTHVNAQLTGSPFWLWLSWPIKSDAGGQVRRSHVYTCRLWGSV